MESALTARDRVGVQDFVLLENHNSEAAFIENLRRRFRESLVYVTKPLFSIIFLQKQAQLVWGTLNVLFSCFGSDIHWLCAGVSEPLQRAGDLLQAADGALPRGQLLWDISTHVSRLIHPHHIFFRAVFCCHWSAANIDLSLIISYYLLFSQA